MRKITEYREPFLGGGSIGLAHLAAHSGEAWLNDRDPGIAALWLAVLHDHNRLIELIYDFTPSVEKFHEWVQYLLREVDRLPESPDAVLELGFKKFVVHQLSFSAMGTQAQTRTLLTQRWRVERMVDKIDAVHAMISRSQVRITNLDFGEVIKDTSRDAFLYLDPPYSATRRGRRYYQFDFREADHLRLAELLRTTSHKWVLSYDDCDFVKRLYSWARIEKTYVTYSLSGTGEKRATALLIRAR